MRRFLILAGFLILLCNPLFADEYPIQEVLIAPLTDSVSFSTVSLDGTSWTTAPTVELRGRKSINILNTSTTDNIFLWSSSETPNTVTMNPNTVSTLITRRLYPKQDITFRTSSDIHFYVSSNTVITVEVTEIR